MTEIDEMDALGLAELVRKKAVSPRELLDHAIERAAQVNPTINAVVTQMHDQAYADIRSGLPVGPLSGVPYLLKDLRAQYCGVPTTHGSRMFRDDVAAQDSELVRRLKAAGLVIFGKTNTSEFGCCPSTEGGYFGTTRNPWDTSLSAGGSSGGSAAAVATRIVPAAHGSDGGGSIRIPAACCGVFGFKPSRGVNPAGPDYGEAWNGLSVEHALTRSVRDSAAILDATRGPSSGDPYCGPTFERSLLAECGRPPGRLRIAVQRTALSGAPVDPECLAAVDTGVRLLESLGHTVEEALPSYDHEKVGAAFALAIAANVQGAIDQLAEKTGKASDRSEIGNVIGVLAAMGHQKTAADMARAVWTLHRAGRAVGPFFDQYDALLSPVVATPPPPLGTLDTTSHDIQAYLGAVFRFIPFTALSNIAGIPSMALPIHWRSDGVPIGIHFTAGYGRDGQLFSLAAQLEAASPWAHRKPALVS